MRDSLKEKCELLAENYTVIHQSFKFEFEMMNLVAASHFTNAGRKADPEKMKECKAIFAKKQGVFSDLRGTIQLALLSKMATESNPAAYLDEVIGVYEKIAKGKFFTSSYMALSAVIICEQHKVGQAEEIIKRMKRIMKKMEKKHPVLTGQEDLPLATLMAIVTEDEDAMIDEMEACFEILKKKFPMHANAVQGLCQVLTMSGSGTEDKCARAVEIFDAMKEQGVKYGKDTELAALGALVDLDMDTEEIAHQIRECSELLKKHKGFGNLALGKEYRAMFAALLVAEEYSSRSGGLYATTLGSSIAIVIAEEIVMLILMSSAAASSASAQ